MKEPNPTLAMKNWLKQAASAPNGELTSVRPSYGIADRMRQLGLVEIVNEPGKIGWPYTGWHIRITKAGREASHA